MTETGRKNIFISAGEQSGELHGSALMKELSLLSDIDYFGLGGDMMINEGLHALAHIKELAATGIAEVAKKYSYFKSVLKKSVETIDSIKPSAIILIDFPGFNLRLAQKIRENYKGKIIYYISPQIWAWHEKRASKIKKNIDKMLVVFPFEVEFYKKFGIEAVYVGHPLVKRIKTFLESRSENYLQASQHNGNIKKITLLPGSRNDELKHHLPVLLDTIEMLKKHYKIDLYISKAPDVNDELFNTLLTGSKDYTIITAGIYSHMFESDLVMTKAGTSTMECSLIGTPFLIFYKTYPVNYFLLKPMVKIKNIGIVNILAGKNIIREFIQSNFKPALLCDEAKKILSDNNYRTQMKRSLEEIWQILGTEDASFNAARQIKNFALI